MNEPTIRDIKQFLKIEIYGFNDKRKSGFRRIKLLDRLPAIQQAQLQQWLDSTYPHLECKVYYHLWDQSYRKDWCTCIQIKPKA